MGAITILLANSISPILKGLNKVFFVIFSFLFLLSQDKDKSPVYEKRNFREKHKLIYGMQYQIHIKTNLIKWVRFGQIRKQWY